MTKRRVNISIVLMLLAILAVTAFQGYWLHKNYREEQQNLELRTNVLFRETVYQLQSEKIKLDTAIRFTSVPATSGLLRTLQGKFRDSSSKVHARQMYQWKNIRAPYPDTCTPGKKNKAITTYNIRATTDSVGHINILRGRTYAGAAGEAGPVNRTNRVFVAKPDSSFDTQGPSVFIDGAGPQYAMLRMLQVVDSLQDSISITEITNRYKKVLQTEKLNCPFVVHRTEGAAVNFDGPDQYTSHQVAMGFNKPYTLSLEVLNPFAFLVRKLSSQIIISILLVGITILSFILLLRNLMQQRKLTQIKSDLISNITHELKTPIATVSVAIEALKNFNALHDPQRTQEYLDISSSELQRLSMLVDKVLKLSMFENHQVELRGETFNLKQLVQEVIASMRLQFEKYQARVSLHVEGNDFTIVADRLHITSVIFNLLDNALKYSKADPVIRVDLAAHSDTIEITVADNGVGILPEYQKKIFEKFFRIPAGDTHNVKGYGLGLSYVAYVVQRHQGRIQVESQHGIGSRFIIKLARTA